MITRHYETFLVPKDARQISCNGGDGPDGHPRVYYTFEGQDSVTCFYCDRLFTKNAVPGAKRLPHVAHAKTSDAA